MPNVPRSRQSQFRRRQPPMQKPKPAPTGGFGSYLKGILPDDLAVAAGAFSMTMLQVRNIQKAEFEKFAQITSSIEVTNKGLPQVNGTDVPVNIPKAQEDKIILALGSGPDGTYTTSDIVGCMSGLPYSWGEILKGIKEAQTTKQKNIYQENYLAVTWEEAVLEPTYTTYDVMGTTYYQVTGANVTTAGGGYGRGGAGNPIITFSDGTIAEGIVGSDPFDLGSLGGGSYGRITSVQITTPGVDGTVIPTCTIQSPPTATLPIQPNGNKSGGGTNTASGTAGWPGMNTVVQAYIDQGVSEVNYIKATKPQIVSDLNVVYDQAGSQLEIEQRARYSAIAPVPIPRSLWVTHYPLTTSTFCDAIATYAPQTISHMYAQTLEAIANLSTVGGQSLVAMLRAERNAERLWKLNTPSENFVPGELKDEIVALLNGNGTVPTAREGLKVRGINGNPNNPVTIYTPPALLAQYVGEQLITPKPFGFYDPNTSKYNLVSKTVPAPAPYQRITKLNRLVPNNRNLLGPARNGTGPAIPIKKSLIDPGAIQSGTTGSRTPAIIEKEPIVVVTSGLEVPEGPGAPIDVGEAEFPGSLAGSNAINTLPLTLDAPYLSAVLLPNTLTVDEAIDEVIKCNCDCWVD